MGTSPSGELRFVTTANSHNKISEHKSSSWQYLVCIGNVNQGMYEGIHLLILHTYGWSTQVPTYNYYVANQVFTKQITNRDKLSTVTSSVVLLLLRRGIN